MRRRKALLFALILLLITFGYWKFFYKTFSEKLVATNADMVFAIDVKRVSNTVIWNYITTPSKWKAISFRRSKETSWKDAIEIPDYFFIFTVSGQAKKSFYCVLKVKNEAALQAMLRKYGFAPGESSGKLQAFRSNSLQLSIIKKDDKILVSNDPATGGAMEQVADNLFNKNQHIQREQLYVNVKASSHLSLQVLDSATSKSDGLLRMNFDGDEVTFDGSFQNRKGYAFIEKKFAYNSNSLFNFAFTRPPAALLSDIRPAVKEKLSSAINFNIDSFLLPQNESYQVDITGFRPRTDSAVTYTYDDDFNRVPNVVVNQVIEPSVGLLINGSAVDSVYEIWKRAGLIEQVDSGELFLPMPFVKTYCKKQSATALVVASADHHFENDRISESAVFHCRMDGSKLPQKLLNYLPAAAAKVFQAIEVLEITAKKKDKTIAIEGRILNKKGRDWLASF